MIPITARELVNLFGVCQELRIPRFVAGVQHCPQYSVGCGITTVLHHTDGLVRERRNSSVLAMELRLSCTNQSIWYHFT